MSNSSLLKQIHNQLSTALMLMFILMLTTGVVYPLLVTGLAQIIFPEKANGSLMRLNDKVIGSEFIGQSFEDPKYFWGRPSATSSFPYNATASNASNLGPTNPTLITTIKERIERLNKLDPNNSRIPIDLVTSSGSGLDPHISPKAALYQIPRIAKIRRLPENSIQNLVNLHLEKRQFGFLGEARINVLKLNLALDQLAKETSK